MARATLKPAEFSATAPAWFSRETTSGVIACHAGSFMTDPNPSKKVNSSSVLGEMQRVNVISPSVAEASTIHHCA